MSLSENDQDNVFVRHFQQQTKQNRSQQQQQQSYNRRSAATSTTEKSDQGSQISPTTVSWPILLAAIPTLGAFFAGSAEVWSDFIMLLLILYYVYKWMTGKYTLLHTHVCY
jgi:hypothetical protein